MAALSQLMPPSPPPPPSPSVCFKISQKEAIYILFYFILFFLFFFIKVLNKIDIENLEIFPKT